MLLLHSTHSDMLYVHFYPVRNTFNFTWDFFFDLCDYLNVYCLIWICYSYFDITDLSSDSIMVKEPTLCDFKSFKFVKVCFIWSILVNVPCDLKKNVYSAIVVKSALRTLSLNPCRLIGSVAQSYTLADFTSAGSTLDSKNSAAVSSDNCDLSM